MGLGLGRVSQGAKAGPAAAATNGSGSMAPPLSLDGENPVQRGGGDPQALGGGDVVFHRLVRLAAADHQHTGTPEVVAGHVDSVLVFLGDTVLQKQRQEQKGIRPSGSGNRFNNFQQRNYDYAQLENQLLK